MGGQRWSWVRTSTRSFLFSPLPHSNQRATSHAQLILNNTSSWKSFLSSTPSSGAPPALGELSIVDMLYWWETLWLNALAFSPTALLELLGNMLPCKSLNLKPFISLHNHRFLSVRHHDRFGNTETWALYRPGCHLKANGARCSLLPLPHMDDTEACTSGM